MQSTPSDYLDQIVQVLSTGVRLKSWTGLRRDSKTLAIFKWAERTKRDLDPFCVVPVDIRVNDLDELIDGCGSPITRIEQFRLESPEETFAGCIVRRTSFARHRASQSRSLHTREPSRPAIVRTAIRVNYGPFLAAINYGDWMEMIVDGKPLWGLLYDEQDSESGNIVFRTRNEIVTRVLLDLVNGGVGHVGEYRVLCDVLRACDGGSAVYRNFVMEILVRNRSKLQRILSYDQGMELFDIARNALAYDDRLLEHHKGIWIDDVGRDTKAAYSQLEKALHTEVHPGAERDAPLEHIHTSMASSIVKMVKTGQQDRTIGFQLVRDHLRQASSSTFFNAHTAHVSANLLFELSQQNGRSGPDEIAMASISDALQEIERAFQLIGAHGRNYFRHEKSIAMLSDLQSKIIRSILDLPSMKALAQKMFDETGNQVGFEVVARRLLVEASEGDKGHAYNGVNDYITECAEQVEARGAHLSVEIIVIRVDLIIRWRIQRFLSIQWEDFTSDVKITLENLRYRDDAIKRFYYAIGLFHQKHVTEANAIFASLRRLQLSASPREIRCYYLGDQGDAQRMQGVIERKHNYSYMFVTELQLSVPMRSPAAGGGSNSVVHAYIAFALNGPTAVLDKPGPSDIGLP